MSRRHPNVAYIFSFVPWREDSYEEYREFRRNYALMYAAHTLRRVARIDEVIAIATELGHADECSFEFVLLQRGEDAELSALADDFAREHGWANDPRELKWFRSPTREFPRTTQRKRQAMREAQRVVRRKERKAERHARKVSRGKR